MRQQIDAAAVLQRDARELEAFLRQFIDARRKGPPRLMEAIEYSLFAGGKRLRPALVMETWHACGGAEASHQPALAAAAGIELVHTFSLVHDDLPAMDDDDLRRGRPASHKAFGEAVAILAGDAMLAMAFEVIVRHAPPQMAGTMIAELAAATGAEGMIGGQALDMEAENQPVDLQRLKQVHRRKTGALLRAACRLGVIAAGADDIVANEMNLFADHLGLAFQIVDDLLDVTSTSEQLGKTANKDRRRGKTTFPSLMGIDESRAEARHQLNCALKALDHLDGRGESLRALAEFVVSRKS